MPTAIALLRVSTPDQQLGLSAQRADIERFAAERGIDVLEYHSEIVSGGADFERRVGLQKAIERVRALRANALVVAKRDRLARDPLVALLTERELSDVDAELLCAAGGNGDDPGEELIRGILDVVARFERRMISIRTKAALAALKASGVKLGGKKPGTVDKNGPRRTRSDKGKLRVPQRDKTPNLSP